MRIAPLFLTFLFAASTFAVGPTSVIGEEVIQPVPAQEISGSPGAEPSESLAIQFKALFSRAMTQIHDRQWELARESFVELRGVGVRVGYENFPEYSAALLDLARVGGFESKEKGGFLVRQALFLSPTDPRVALLAGQFWNELGYRESIATLASGISLLWRHPSLVISFATELTIVVLFALVVSLLFLCAVQLGVYGGEIVEGLGDRFPRQIWGFAGPICFFLFVSVPLVGGVVVVIACWSLLLAWFVPRCRWLPALVGSVVLAWGFALGVLHNTSAYVNSPIQNALEEENNGSFGVGHETLLTSARASDPTQTTVVPVVAMYLARNGKLDESKSLIERGLAEFSTDPGVVRTLTANLGAIEHRRGNHARAKELLGRAESLGDDSFENAHLSAQVALSLTDLTAQEQYYHRASERDLERLRALDEFGSGVASLQVPLPQRLFYQRFLRPVTNSRGELLTGSYGVGTRIASSLMYRGSETNLIFLGGGILMLGAMARFRRKNARQELRNKILGEPSDRISRIWALIPGGLFVAGRRPILGLAVVALAIVLLIFAVELPIQLPVVSALVAPYRTVVLGLSLALLCGSSLTSLRRQTKVYSVGGS